MTRRRPHPVVFVLSVALTLVATGPGLARAASAKAPRDASARALTTDQAWREIDGVRALARRVTARPRSVAAHRAAGLGPAAAAARANAARTRLLTDLHRHHAAVDEYVLLVPAGVGERDFAEALLATGDYEYVEPDWLVAAAAVDPGDPLLPLQWHHERIDACNAWAITPGDPNVVIAICDTGVDLTHPDLEPVLVPGYNSVDDLAQEDGGDVTPRTDHGTQVAGVAAAAGANGIGIAGVGLDLRIMPVRVSNLTVDQAFTSDINAGARWAAEQGALVVNASYSAPLAAGVETTGDYIRGLGSIYVWSAGNSGGALASADPAAVLIVGATDQSDMLAGFSNFGTAIDLVAPGVDIYTTSPDGAYGPIDGTSFAAPIASGVLGLMWSVDPDLTPERAELLLRMTTTDLGSPGEDFLYGAGRIDAAAAVGLAREAAGAALPPITRDDLAEALNDDPVSIDVLANDFDANGDVVTLSGVAPVGTGGGTASIERGAGPNGRDMVVYVRPASFSGVDEVTYIVRDEGGLEATGTIRVTVDDPPVFADRVDVALELGLGPFGPRQTVPADLDDDGDFDLVTCIRATNMPDSEGIVVLRNDGTGAMTREPGITTAGESVNWIDAADFNDDGRDDVVVVNEASDTVSIALANADGTLDASVALRAGNGPRHVIARDAIGVPLDLDEDGFVDVATANAAGNSVSVLYGRGDGTFEPTVTFGTDDGADGLGPWTVSAGDLDQDDRIDLVTANVTGGVTVLRADGDRSFADPILIQTPFENKAGLVVDLDGDDDLDLVVSTGPGGESYLGVALGDAGISFGSFALYELGTNTNGLAVADVDLDGDLDVVATNQSSADVSILLNRGDGTFFGSDLREPTGLGPIGISVTDVDADGRGDLVVTQAAIDAVAIFRNETPRASPDFDGDGFVGFAELMRILAAWGPCADCPEDLTGTGSVGFEELQIVLQAWTS